MASAIENQVRHRSSLIIGLMVFTFAMEYFNLENAMTYFISLSGLIGYYTNKKNQEKNKGIE